MRYCTLRESSPYYDPNRYPYYDPNSYLERENNTENETGYVDVDINDDLSASDPKKIEGGKRRKRLTKKHRLHKKRPTKKRPTKKRSTKKKYIKKKHNNSRYL